MLIENWRCNTEINTLYRRKNRDDAEYVMYYNVVEDRVGTLKIARCISKPELTEQWEVWEEARIEIESWVFCPDDDVHERELRETPVEQQRASSRDRGLHQHRAIPILYSV